MAGNFKSKMGSAEATSPNSGVMARRSDENCCHPNDAAFIQRVPDEETVGKKQRLEDSRDETLTAPSSGKEVQAPPQGSQPLSILSQELIEEILSRLPVKYLLQFRCVCKSWNSLISDPQFVKKHLRLSTMDTKFTDHNIILSFMKPKFTLRSCSVHSIFNSLPTIARKLKNPLKNRNRYDLIVGSCNGLLCFAINQSFALLWNPAIRIFKKSPYLENKRLRGSYTVYGFGYDHLNDSYKVVAIFCYDSDGRGAYKTEVKVYTLGTNSWRKIQEPPSGVPFDEPATYVNSTLNWVASTRTTHSSWVIISLDLREESYQELLPPDYEGTLIQLGALRDNLCILCYYDTHSDVWLMKDYGVKESWTKFLSIPYLEGPKIFPCLKAPYISENDEILLDFQGNLVLYNLRINTFKHPDIQDINGWVDAEVYVESLISPCY